MMTQAFYTGLSGLKSTQTSIDVTSDNIANVSTVGYREYGVEFSSLYEDMLSTGENVNATDSSVGLGAQVQTTSMKTGNGTIMETQRDTDLAITGDGWFGVSGEEGMMFTRAGDFTFDVNADLVTTGGARVMGTMGNNIEDGVLTSTQETTPLGDIGAQEPLNFPTDLTYPPQATTTASFYGNLGAVEDPAEPIVMSASVIDPNGDTNHLELEFIQSETQPESGTSWTVSATTKTTDGETIYDAQSGTVTFGPNGELVSSTLGTIDNNGAPITVDFGTSYDGLTSSPYMQTSASSSTDGVLGGDLIGYEVVDNGNIVASFTNGAQSSIGQVAVYHFQNDQGLQRVGATSYMQSSNSGDALFFQDENGENILGTGIANYSLESSNVNMDVALTELIVLQRSFDSNSTIITTVDEMLKKAIDM